MSSVKNNKKRLAEFINTCSDAQLLEFVEHAAQFGSMELVRKLMLVWVTCASDIEAKKQTPNDQEQGK